ncbi:MAG: IPTL-CTERM sorting domain-containing protein [Thermodesulfobacteriota bacterium]
MVSKKRLTTFVASLFIFGFLFLALPQNGFTQEIDPGCCQYGLEEGERFCADSGGLCRRPIPPTSFDGFFPGETCNEQTGFCSGIQATRDVPTLSEWGLIAMAGVLGVVGFMVMRRKRATA